MLKRREGEGREMLRRGGKGRGKEIREGRGVKGREDLHDDI